MLLHTEYKLRASKHVHASFSTFCFLISFQMCEIVWFWCVWNSVYPSWYSFFSSIFFKCQMQSNTLSIFKYYFFCFSFFCVCASINKWEKVLFFRCCCVSQIFNEIFFCIRNLNRRKLLCDGAIGNLKHWEIWNRFEVVSQSSNCRNSGTLIGGTMVTMYWKDFKRVTISGMYCI